MVCPAPSAASATYLPAAGAHSGTSGASPGNSGAAPGASGPPRLFTEHVWSQMCRENLVCSKNPSRSLSGLANPIKESLVSSEEALVRCGKLPGDAGKHSRAPETPETSFLMIRISSFSV